MREAGDIRILYDRRSGQTHLLAPDLAAVLDALLEGDGGPAEIVGRLSRDRDMEVETGAVIDAVAARLDELDRLALADRLA